MKTDKSKKPTTRGEIVAFRLDDNEVQRLDAIAAEISEIGATAGQKSFECSRSYALRLMLLSLEDFGEGGNPRRVEFRAWLRRRYRRGLF